MDKLPPGLSNSTAVRVYYGGAERISAQIKQFRNSTGRSVTVHGGDAVTGTLYYSIFGPQADAAYMNAVEFDALVAGNHEFDDGDSVLAEFATLLDAPILSYNLNPGESSALRKLPRRKKIKKWVTKKVGRRDFVAICGITVKSGTEQSSNPDEGTTLDEEVASAIECVAQVTAKGHDKIVLLTHIGYGPDLLKMATIPGVDVVIGGHSHTLLGDSTLLNKGGFSPLGPYATLVGRTCVVQAWEYNKMVGKLDVDFSRSGVVRSCTGTVAFPINPTRFTRTQPAPSMDLNVTDAAIMRDYLLSLNFFTAPEPDANVTSALKQYRDGVSVLKAQRIATVPENICHSRGGGAVDANCPNKVLQTAVGGGVCHIVAKGFLYNVPTADVAIQNSGGCRVSIVAGNLTYGDAYAILPFSNTLVTLVMTGDQIRRVLEDAVQFFLVLGGSGGAYPFGAGLRWYLNYTAPFGSRFTNIMVNKRLESTWSPLNLTESYTVVTNNFVATPRDGYVAFGEVNKTDPTKYVDTYVFYAQSLVEYAKYLDVITDPPLSEYSTSRLTIANGTTFVLL